MASYWLTDFKGKVPGILTLQQIPAEVCCSEDQIEAAAELTHFIRLPRLLHLNTFADKLLQAQQSETG